MATYNITADELLLIYLTFIARDEEGHHIEYFNKWFENGGSKQLRNLFESLKSKGIIHKDYMTDTWDPNQIEFNKTFIKSWIKNSLCMGEELFNAYPPFINIGGIQYPLRDIGKKFSSLDEFCFFYSTQIGHNPEKHKEVMDIFNWAKDNGYINFGICSFTIGRQWEALKELRNNPEIAPIAHSYDVNENG